MSQLNVTRQGGEVMLDNPSRTGTADYTTPAREFRPVVEKSDWRLTAVMFVGGVLTFLIIWLAWGIWKTTFCWGGSNFETCETIVTVEPIVIAGLLLSAVGITFWRIVAETVVELRQKKAYANRTNLTLDRFGNQLPADLYERIDPAEMMDFIQRRYAADLALKAHTAQFEQYWGINALSYGSTTAQAAPALPSPADTGVDVGPMPVSEWMQHINNTPHLMLCSRTGGGKSSLAKAVLAPRIEAGEKVFVIDPHSSEWWVESVGGGENWAEVETALGVVLAEYKKRLQIRDDYKAETGKEMSPSSFERISIVIDEATITKAHFDSYNKKENPWTQFVAVMGSGSRKVRLSVILLCQSANVEDLGISGPLRENFTRIALDDRGAKQLVNFEEMDKARREAIYAKLPSLTYPAVAVINSECVLLDRTGLDRVAEPANSADAAWTEGYEAVKAASVRSSRSEDAENTLLEGFLFGRTASNGACSRDKLAELRELQAQGMTRDQARAAGYQFTNASWSLAAKNSCE